MRRLLVILIGLLTVGFGFIDRRCLPSWPLTCIHASSRPILN